MDKDFEQTMWVAGNACKVSYNSAVPPDVPDGPYDLRLTMMHASAAPRIRFAIVGGDGELGREIRAVRPEGKG